MNWIEMFAALLGIISVWYARKENILVFPFGIANVLIYIYICFAARLYANAGINVVYLISNIYGWYMWARKDENNGSLQITRNTSKQNVWSWVSVVIVYAAAFFVLREANKTDPDYLHSYLPYIDSFNTSFFLVATILMAVKKAENWVFWIIGDLVSIPIFVSQGLYFTGVQYTVFLVLAISGWIEWKKKVKSANIKSKND
jgi:nicotinamide mononucleotide transporter